MALVSVGSIGVVSPGLPAAPAGFASCQFECFTLPVLHPVAAILPASCPVCPSGNGSWMETSGGEAGDEFAQANAMLAEI